MNRESMDRTWWRRVPLWCWIVGSVLLVAGAMAAKVVLPMVQERQTLAVLEFDLGVKVAVTPGLQLGMDGSSFPDWLKRNFGLYWHPLPYWIDLPAGFPKDRLRLLRQIRTVQSLSITDDVDDVELLEITRLKGLQKLKFPGSRVTDTGMRVLSPLMIYQLSISDAKFGDKGAAVIGGLFLLRSLRLDGWQLTESGLKALSKLRVETLSLNGTPLEDSQLAVFGSMPELLQLELDRTRVTDAGMSTLAGLNLARLSLNDTGIGDAGVAALSKLESIRHLRLNRTRLTDAAMESLSRLPHLDALELAGTAVTDKGLSRLPPDSCEQLLNLEHTRLTTAGLIALPVNPGTLNVSNTSVRFGPELLKWVESRRDSSYFGSVGVANCGFRAEEIEQLSNAGDFMFDDSAEFMMQYDWDQE